MVESETESLASQIAELQRALAARDRFISAVGHEIRNAMAPLVLLAESLQDSNDRQSKLLTRNLHHLTTIVDRIRDVAALRAESFALDRKSVELGDTVGRVVEELEPLATAAKVELRFVIHRSVTGQWDSLRVKQIAHHLIGNAIRHSGSDHVNITVARDAQLAVLTVEDHGCGIAADARPRLFDPFGSTTKQHGGFGVGLWIVHTLCARLGGSVLLADKQGPGACFRATLPADEDAAG